MTPDRIPVPASITFGTARDAVTDATCDNCDFDHRKFSLWDAEQLERAAQAIRRGYAESKPESREPPDAIAALKAIVTSPLGEFLRARGKLPFRDYGWANADTFARSLGWTGETDDT